MFFNFCIYFISVPAGIASSVVGLKVCAITAGIKKYKAIINTKKKKHNKIVLLANTVEVLNLKTLIDSYVNYDECFFVNNVLREYNKMKKETPNPENSLQYTV